MKLRSLLEHEPGAPPPAWAAAGLTGLTEPETTLTGAPLWELALLHKHYHSHLSQAAAAVALIPPQGRPSFPHTLPCSMKIPIFGERVFPPHKASQLSFTPRVPTPLFP